MSEAQGTVPLLDEDSQENPGLAVVTQNLWNSVATVGYVKIVILSEQDTVGIRQATRTRRNKRPEGRLRPIW